MESGKRLRRLVPGEIYRASTQNEMVEAIERVGRIGSSSLPMGVGPGGVRVDAPAASPMFAKITAIDGNGDCSWVEQVPVDGGGWEDGSFSGGPGNDPAREANGATPDSFPFNAILARVSLYGWHFWMDTCS